MGSIVNGTTTISLAGKEYELSNSLEVRKQFCLRMGGLRQVLTACSDMNEYAIAQIIVLASGQPAKKVDAVFERIFEEGTESVVRKLSPFLEQLLGGGQDEEEEPGNEQSAGE
jgi:hypothetical protein